MFRIDGYINVCRIRHWFDVNTLEKEIQRALIVGEKRKILQDAIRSSNEYLNELDDDKRRAMIGRENLSLERMDAEVSDGEALRAAEKWGYFALRRYLHSRPLYLAGPNDAIIPTSADIVSADFRTDNHKRVWNFLSERFLSVDVSDRLKIVDAAKVVASHEWLMNRSIMSRRGLLDFIALEPAFRSLLPFEGFFLAVEKHDPPSIEDMWGFFGFGSPDRETSEETSEPLPARGRPRKQEEALRIYTERFPNGHVGYTWPMVLRILEVERGYRVSEDTLRGAIKARENIEKGP